MSFNSLCTDKITLEKKDGRKFKNIQASVQKNKIFIFPENVKEYAIEVGDIIARELPNGTIERYEVEDPCFYSGIGSFSDHYQATVRRCDAKPRISTLNITVGNASKIMVNSTDNSINVQITNDNVWDKLTEVVKTQCHNNSDLLRLIAEMKETKGTSKFKEKYQAFIESAANHITVLSPFIPILSSLL